MNPLYVNVRGEFLVNSGKFEHKQIAEEKVSEVAETVKNDGEFAVKEEGTDSNKRKVNEDKSKTNKMSSKKRHGETHISKEERLCSFITKGEVCPFGEKCEYLHDAKRFLTTKPPDLGSTCYQYDTYGYCPNGVMCRFGSCHIDKETGANLKRPAELGGLIPKESLNMLKKEVQIALRKKNYDGYIKSKQASTNNTQNSNISSADNTGNSNGKEFDSTPYPDKFVKLVDFSNKVYIAPLTTVGNLPFRRIMRDFGADITCGEMAMADNIQTGQASEWALLRKHPNESIFGVQLAGNQVDLMSRVSKMLYHETQTDFVDINCGCPIDLVCDRGCGSSLMNKHKKLCDIVNAMTKQFKGNRSVTVKIRTGWDDKHPTTHKLLPLLQQYSHSNLAAVMIHGRSRLQRYSKFANWDYILQVAQSQDMNLPRIPVIGNGDIYSWDDWKERLKYMTESQVNDENPEAIGLCNCAMLARGVLVKPWLPQEIKEQRNIDISATERFEILKKFCNYGMDHWGSDQQGINTTRRFLLEWMSFLHRYVPLGLIEGNTPQKMNQRPPNYFGRDDMETLLSSSSSQDWIKISELLLGPVPENFTFIPKHKSNSYAAETDMVSNG